MSENEYTLLKAYQHKHNLRQGKTRELILKVFLNEEKHVTADELWRLVQQQESSVGQASVYRALKIFVDCGICRELDMGISGKRYEHQYDHEHHDHLICKKCGAFEEVIEQRIEKLQEKIAKERGFILEDHSLKMYGTCKKCQK